MFDACKLLLSRHHIFCDYILKFVQLIPAGPMLGESMAQDGRVVLTHRVLNRSDKGDPAETADAGADGLHCHKTLTGALQHFATGILICTIRTELFQATGLVMGTHENTARCYIDQSTGPMLVTALLLFHTELDPFPAPPSWTNVLKV